MVITKDVWQHYIDGLDTVSEHVKKAVREYILTHDVESEEGRDALVKFSYAMASKYGEAAAEFACQMYDAIGELEEVTLEPAEPAETATLSDVYKAVNGTLDNILKAEITAAAIARLVKLCGQDTTLKNAIRDKAYYAWIPLGDTCPFCLSIAAEGWKRASQKALSGGHAEHIHGNCNCAYSIKHKEDTSYPYYDPSKYAQIFEDAEGDTKREKLNSVRRMVYDENSAEIRAQKKSAYERSKLLESSEAEEIEVN